MSVRHGILGDVCRILLPNEDFVASGIGRWHSSVQHSIDGMVSRGTLVSSKYSVGCYFADVRTDRYGCVHCSRSLV
jgi:hypothetical protein